MREIKFRAFAFGLMYKYAMPTLDAKRVNISQRENGNMNTYVNIEDCELMQYTGLKDRNGKEIYEGDIVNLWGWGRKNSYDGKTTIVWDIDVIGWNFERATYAEDRYDFQKAISNCEVIGNIYENHELLK